jgi:hypothetical protein
MEVTGTRTGVGNRMSLSEHVDEQLERESYRSFDDLHLTQSD